MEHIYEITVSALLAAGGWVLKMLYNKLSDNDKKLSDKDKKIIELELAIARHYVSQAQFNDFRNEMRSEFRSMKEDIKSGIRDLNETIDKRLDK